jgi:hypothetical protein
MDQVGPGRTKSAQAPAECDKRRDKLPFAELNLCLRCMLSEREGQESRGGGFRYSGDRREKEGADVGSAVCFTVQCFVKGWTDQGGGCDMDRCTACWFVYVRVYWCLGYALWADAGLAS